MANNRKGLSIAQNILFSSVLLVIVSLGIVTILLTLTYTSSTYNVVESSSREINKQVILNYENYIESVIDTANYIQEKTTEYGLKYDTSNLGPIYAQAADIQSDIESIVLIDYAGGLIVKSTQKDLTSEDLTQKQYYLDAVDKPGIYHFSSPHVNEIIVDSTEEVITVSKVIDYYLAGEKRLGILVIDLNTENLISLSNTTNLGEQGHIVILNSDDSLVYSNKNRCFNTDCDSVVITKEIIFGGKLVSIDDIDFYTNVNTLTNTRWRIATFINVEIISSSQQRSFIIVGIVVISTLGLAIVISFYISRRISSPMMKLQKHMQVIEKGNLYKKIEVEGQKEVVVLSDSFNGMIEEIRGLMDTILVEQKEKRKTEFIALQTQINPHFLYNTLDSIVYLSENNDNDKVQEMVIALSRFFRISISKGKNIIPLEEELEHARNYLLIQKIRYNEKFDFKFEIDENTLNLKVVKLVLQPLIENAIYHGINTEFDSGTITIRSLIKDDKLILEVEDDGYGITESKIEELYQSMRLNQKQSSVGLRNVYQRLKLYYGDETEFIIESELDENTIMRLIIPLERTE